MRNKIIVIGASTTGKSTLLRSLKEKISLPLLEMDEELKKLNGGIFPSDFDQKMRLSALVASNILERSEVVFFTNTDYFAKEDLLLAREKGFFVVQFVLPRKEMEIRNRNRVENEGYDDLSKHFENMLCYQAEIQNDNLIDKIIETNNSLENIEKEFLALV